jgi:hypothetical protein
VGAQGATGSQGATGPQGAQGNFGGITFEYVFDTDTAHTDPGAGKLKFSNANISLASELKIDDVDVNSTDIQSYLRTIDDSTSTIKGHFRISNKADSSDFALFTISAVTEETGFFDVDCSYVSGSATAFSNNESIIITFARTGDVGAQGPQGPQGAQGPQGPQGINFLGAYNPSTEYFLRDVVTYGGSSWYMSSPSSGGTGYTPGDSFRWTLFTSAGATGPQGPQGPQGEPGFSGVGGAEGPQGPEGPQGSTGPQGTQGATGAQGATGPVAGSAYQVVYKDSSNNPAGSVNLQYDTSIGLALEGDLRVDGAAVSSTTLRVDSTNHRVGIGTATPDEKLDVDGNIALTGSVIFEGATANTYETTLSVTDPTDDRTITLPNATGTVALTTNVRDNMMKFIMEVM